MILVVFSGYSMIFYVSHLRITQGIALLLGLGLIAFALYGVPFVKFAH